MSMIYHQTEHGVLYHGDCLDILPTLADKSVDLVLTDIPYGNVNRDSNGLRNFDKGIADIVDFDMPFLLYNLDCLCRGSFYIFCGFGQISQIYNVANQEHNPRLIIWEKTNPSPINGEHIWISGIEPAVYWKKAGARFNGMCENTVLRFATSGNKYHTTQKPIDLFTKLVLISSDETDKVLDPFAGSGTTAVACINTNRRYILIEKEEKYCEIAAKRIESALDQTDIFREDI